MRVILDSDSELRHTNRHGMLLIEIVGAIAMIVAIFAVAVFMLMPAQRVGRESARRSQCRNNLKQIALALHNYADKYGSLPPAYTVDETGQPLHSWRTLILPFMDEQTLYETIDLTKPWDDPANANACNQIVPEYLCPSAIYPAQAKVTMYLAIVTPASCLQEGKPRLVSDVTDRQADTVMLVEVDFDHAVPWMSPRDADESMLRELRSSNKLSHTGGMHVGCVDGTVRFMNATISESLLKALISIAGNETLENW